VALDEKPAHIVVAVTDVAKLPDEFRTAFVLHPRGYYDKDYLRAELHEDKLSQMPKMRGAIRALVARSVGHD
jgi:hypothetical protein